MKFIQRIITYCMCLFIFVLLVSGCANQREATTIYDQVGSVFNLGTLSTERPINEQGQDDTTHTGGEIGPNAPDIVHVYAIDVGQGDAFLIKVGNEYSMIDTGDRAHRPNIVAYLRELGVKKIKNIIITHGDEDHMGGFLAIAKNFEIENVYDNGIAANNSLENSYRLSIERKNIKYRSLHKGDTVDFGGHSTFTVYAPWEDVIKDSKGKPDLNNNSIVGKFKFDKFSMLFTGDAGTIEEDRLVKEQNSKLFARVLKVSHHGSNYNSSTKFIRSVRPEIGVISVGLDNRYNHPGDKVLARLQAEKVAVYRTDTMGRIHIRTDGQSWQVETER